MVKTKVAINGFGRIGRLAFRELEDSDQFEVVAINDLATSEMMSYLLKYDTVQGTFAHADMVSFTEDTIVVGNHVVAVFREPAAHVLPWGELGVDLVLECSGAYKSKMAAQAHIDAGAKRVVISAPAGPDVPTVVYGINERIIDKEDAIISAASCSTNALAPMLAVLHAAYAIQCGIMTVIHGYTATQMLQDDSQKSGNLRRSRAAAENIIPTTAEAAKAVGRVIPELAGKLDGSAVRVPIPAGCLITFVATVVANSLTAGEVNQTMKAAASDIFGYTEEEYVSSDIIGMKYASLFDASQTIVCDAGNGTSEVRIAAWFDNETSFTHQMLRTARYFINL